MSPQETLLNWRQDEVHAMRPVLRQLRDENERLRDRVAELERMLAETRRIAAAVQ